MLGETGNPTKYGSEGRWQMYKVLDTLRADPNTKANLIQVGRIQVLQPMDPEMTSEFYSKVGTVFDRQRAIHRILETEGMGLSSVTISKPQKERRRNWIRNIGINFSS